LEDLLLKTKISKITSKIFALKGKNLKELKENIKEFYTNAKGFGRDILSKPTNYIMHVTVIALSFFVSISTVYGNSASIYNSLMPESEKVTDKVVSTKVNPQTIALIAEVTNAPIDVKEEELENDLPSLTSSLSLSDSSSVESFIGQDVPERGREKVIAYTVQDGDTIWSIAKNFEITTNTIKWVNNLGDIDNIKPGQVLQILPISGTLHKVGKDDTLPKIASAYSASVPQIVEENGLLDEQVVEGQVLVIPGGFKPEPKPVPNNSGKKLAGNDKKSSQKQAKFISGPRDSAGWLIRPTSGMRTQGRHANNGIDIANASMPPVWAAAAGTVTFAGWDGAYGLTVKIRHSNGVETQYSHLNKIYIYGGSVGQGQIIGQMGRTGRVYGRTGIHLHFEVHGGRNPF